MMGAELWSAAERAGQEVLLVNSGQHLSRGALERPVRDSLGFEPRQTESFSIIGSQVRALGKRVGDPT
jgi:hypothetical protein